MAPLVAFVAMLQILALLILLRGAILLAHVDSGLHDKCNAHIV